MAAPLSTTGAGMHTGGTETPQQRASSVSSRETPEGQAGSAPVRVLTQPAQMPQVTTVVTYPGAKGRERNVAVHTESEEQASAGTCYALDSPSGSHRVFLWSFHHLSDYEQLAAVNEGFRMFHEQGGRNSYPKAFLNHFKLNCLIVREKRDTDAD